MRLKKSIVEVEKECESHGNERIPIKKGRMNLVVEDSVLGKEKYVGN